MVTILSPMIFSVYPRSLSPLCRSDMGFSEIKACLMQGSFATEGLRFSFLFENSYPQSHEGIQSAFDSDLRRIPSYSLVPGH